MISNKVLRAVSYLMLCLLCLQSCIPQPEPHSSAFGMAPQGVMATEPDTLGNVFWGSSLSDRENWQKPQIVISSLGDLSDKTVADIGAGTGYFTLPLARLAQKVIAVDIEQQFLDHIEKRLARIPEREGLEVETRFTVPDDPALKSGEADLVLVVNTYSFIDNRVAYFKKVLHGLKPKGRVVVVDFKYENLPVGPPMDEKVPTTLVASELDSAGFQLISADSQSLGYQYIVTFERR